MHFIIQKNTCLGQFLELFADRESITLAALLKKLPRSSFYHLTKKRLSEFNMLVKKKAGCEIIARAFSGENRHIVYSKSPYVEIRNIESVIEVEIKR